MINVRTTGLLAHNSLIRPAIRAVFRDSPFIGLVRMFLATSIAVAVGRLGWNSTHNPDAFATLVIWAVFTCLYACIVGAREVVITAFAPDYALWHANDNLGPSWRVGLTCLRHVLAWMLFAALTSHGLLALVPVAASGLQQVVHRLARPQGRRS